MPPEEGTRQKKGRDPATTFLEGSQILGHPFGGGKDRGK